MNITTKYQTNAKGVGQIVAKGGGRQRTIPYDHAKSIHANHGTAVGNLAGLLGIRKVKFVSISVGVDNGVGHFTLEV